MGQMIVSGSEDQRTRVHFMDSSTGVPETGVSSATAGLALWYWRPGDSNVSVPAKTPASLNDSHVDGGLLHIDHGDYDFHLPDAACASGVDFVSVGGYASGMIMIGPEIPLVGYSFTDGVRLGLAALPNAAAGSDSGLPLKSNISTASNMADVILDEALSGHVAVGTVGKAIGDIDTHVDSILADTGTDGVVLADDAITSAKIDSNAITATAWDSNVITYNAIADDTFRPAQFDSNVIEAAALSAGAIDKIHDEVIDGTITVRQAQKIILAFAAGKVSGGGTTTIAFRDHIDSNDIISMTVDSNGNRTVVSVSP